ncbi:hypothetical protein [Phenylobacterium sp.]|uniref:hypothetical protein n=1 Tax=Phenylobacterium sp. TaxID=1871053 RepID=UPI002733D619|nr:hypothetical protein [Phenylobacterium sp.]MDP3855160.1 hypothetical protein [Phenylobacterium sp.]
MIRTFALSTLAVLAISAPAQAASVKVNLVGKSPAQIEADVTKAAKKVCFYETRSETLALDAYGRCVKATTKTALSQLATAQAQAGTTLAAR